MSRNRNIIIGFGSLAVVLGLFVSFLHTYTPAPTQTEVSAVLPQPAATSSSRDVAKKTIEVSFSLSTGHFSDSVVLGSTAYDFMDKLRAEKKISFTADYYDGLGYFITSVNGLKNDPAHSKYWTYYINGTEASLGASSYVLKPGDDISWKYGADFGKNF